MKTLIGLLIVLAISSPAIADPGYVITTSSNPNMCQGGNITLTAVAPPVGATFQWTKNTVNLPGANLSTFTINNATAAESGSYSVIINGGAIHYDTISIVVNPNPTGDFSFNNHNTCSGTNIQFASTVLTGTAPYTYFWDFGDGVTSTLPNPIHAYTSLGCGTGNFTVKLTITDANGCATTITKANAISVKQAPDVRVSDQNVFFPFSNCDNNPTPSNPNYTLTLNNSSPSAACITSYSISWGDGVTQNNVAFPISHTYTALGSFNLTVTAVGTNGCSYTKTYSVANQSNPAGSLGTLGSTTGLCAPDSVRFTISNWQLNSPGTMYVLNYGDGRADTLSHPLTTDTVRHTYATSSCPAPTYTATLYAINGCATTPFTAGNIQIRIKPTATFTLPNTVACINQNVCFTNTTTQGFTGASCSGATLYNWDFGDGSPTSSDANPCHTYTTPGTYTVTLTASNPCGSSVTTQQICVTNPVIPSFTVDKTSGCASLTVTATNTSNLATCGTSAYLWTVAYASSNCGTSSSWTFAAGSTASSPNPVFIFNNAGTYTITLRVTSPCGIVTSNQAITVTRPPTASINTILNACGAVTLNPTATVANCGSGSLSYLWTFGGGTPGTSTVANPTNITFSSSGVHTITLDVTNECGTTTATRSFTVSAQPDVTVPANQVFCPGDATGGFTFSSTLVGTTFSWTNSNTAIGLAASGSGNTIPSFAVSNPGSNAITATITVTVSNGGCTNTGTFTITVNPRPPLPVVTTPVVYCQNAAGSQLSATNANGHTLLWYTTASGGVGDATAPTPGTAVVGSTTYYVSQVNTSTNCEGNRAAIVVTVNATPAISAANATNPTSCASSTGSIVLSGLTASVSYTVNYTKNGVPVTVTLNSNGAGNLTVGSLTSGIYDNITVTRGGCTSNAVGPYTLSDPNPPATPTASSNGPVCSGTTLNLAATSATAGVSYTWSGPNTFSSNQQNPAITNVTVAASGMYSVTATLAGCTSPAGTVNVVIDPTPASVTASSNSPICSGNDITFNSNSSTAGVSYAWTGPNTFSSNAQSPSINNAGTIHSGTYIVTATLGNCSATAQTNVVVNLTPAIAGSSSSDPTNCNTSTGIITLSGLTPSTSFTVNYLKNGVPQTATISSNVNGEVVISSLTAGTYTNVRVSRNNCQSNAVGPFVLVDPNPPATPVATSNGPLCSGNTLTLGATTTTPGTATWSWTGPNGFSSAAQNPSINNTSTAATGMYSVTVTINSCTSAAGTVNVVVNQTPATPVVTSNSPLCTGSTVTLNSSTTSAGIMTYAWTGPNNFSSTLQNPTIPNATGAASGVYNVVYTATVGNCPSAPGSTTVSVNQTPAILGSSFSNPVNCNTATGSITLTGLLANTSYTVNYNKNGNPQTATITSNGTGIVAIANLTAGNYSNVVVGLTGCTSSGVGPFVLVDPNPPSAPTAGSNSPICNGGQLQLTASTPSTGNIIYSWTGPNGFATNQQNPTIPNATAAANGWYYVTASLNNCTSLSDSVLVSVNGLPAAPTVTSPVNYCIGTPSVPLTATPLPGNSLRWYTVALGGTSSPTAPTPSTAVAGSTNYYVSQATPLGCEGTRAVVTVIINPDARAQYTYLPDTSCAPFNINSTVIQPLLFPAQNGTYEWYANGVLIGTGTTFPGYIINNPQDSVNIKLKTISPFGCKSDSVNHWFHTFPVPVTNFTVSDTVGCGPLSVTFTNTTPQPGRFKFHWDFANGITSNQTNPGTIVFAANPLGGDTVYHVTLSAITPCDTVIKTIDIRVKSKPRSLFTPSRTYGCSPMTVTFTNTSLGENMSFVWEFGDGATLTTNSNGPVQHTYHTGVQDTFTVRLITSNLCGIDSASYAIVVAPRSLNLNFAVNGNEKTGCSPHTVRFINNSTGATNFRWDFGDGNIRNTTNNVDTIIHTYVTNGVFTVRVQAANGCTDTTGFETISVFAKPVVNFSVAPLPACLGDTLHFVNQTDTATGLFWNFDDGITSQLTNPTHAYITPGTYNVKLVAFRQYAPGTACSDSITYPVTILASQPGSFTASDTASTCAPFTVTFTNNNIPSALTTWNFGNGAVDTGDVVTYTFTTNGTFTVTMNAVSPGGCRYQAQRTIVVSAPTGTFTYDDGFICGEVPVRFEVAGFNIDSIRWNFGDGVILTTTNHVVYHTYMQSGSYVPSVQLIAGTSCSVNIPGLDTIKIDNTNAGFRSVQNRQCGFTTVSFTDTSRAYFGIQQWQWSFGDGNTSAQQHPIHNYQSTGTYNVRLVIITPGGCRDTITQSVYVKVNDIPVTSIQSNSTGCQNELMNFSAIVNAVDPVTSYNWNMGNGFNANTSGVQIAYGAAGNYTVQLIVGTSESCFDTATAPIVIYPAPNTYAGVDVGICVGQSTPLNASGANAYLWSPTTGLNCFTCPNPVANPSLSTQYVVTGTNNFGCTKRDTIVVTVAQPFNISHSSNTNICIGDSVRLIASGAHRFEWFPATGLDNPNSATPLARPTVTTTYRVIGFDNHGCFTDTGFVTIGVGGYPIVNAGQDRILATGSTVTFNPTATNGPITLWQWSPATDLSCSVCPQPIATAKKDICYQVTATNAFGCSGSDSVCIRVFCESAQVFIPNAFTPDGDGRNDILMVRGTGINQVKSFRIFNRWGQVVFERAHFAPNDPQFGWNGLTKGVAAPPDVYVYTCEVICENDATYTYKGNVAIIK